MIIELMSRLISKLLLVKFDVIRVESVKICFLLKLDWEYIVNFFVGFVVYFGDLWGNCNVDLWWEEEGKFLF